MGMPWRIMDIKYTYTRICMCVSLRVCARVVGGMEQIDKARIRRKHLIFIVAVVICCAQFFEEGDLRALSVEVGDGGKVVASDDLLLLLVVVMVVVVMTAS